MSVLNFNIVFQFLMILTESTGDAPEVLKLVSRVKLDSPAKIALSLDGYKIACVGGDGVLRILGARDGHEFARSKPIPRATAIVFSPTGDRVASAGGLKSLLPDPLMPLARVGNIEEMKANGGGMVPDEEYKTMRLSVFNPNIPGTNSGPVLCGGYVRVFGTSTADIIHSYDDFEHPIESLSFDREGANLTVVDTRFNVIRRELRTGKNVPHNNNHGIRIVDYPMPQTVFSGDGLVVASLACEEIGRDLRVKLFDGRKTSFWTLGRESDCDQPWSIALSPDGERIILGGRSGWVDIWSINSRRPLKSFELGSGEGREIAFIAIDPPGRRTFVGDLNGRIGVWDLVSGRRLAVANGPIKDIRAVSFGDSKIRILSGGFRKVRGIVDDLIIQDFELSPPNGP